MPQTDVINSRIMNFCREHEISSWELIPEVKNLLFRNRTLSIPLNINEPITQEQYKKACDILAFITTEIAGVSAQELDSIWSDKMLRKIKIKNLADKIYNATPAQERLSKLFSKKYVVLSQCFPEYYERTYGDVDIVGAFINPTGDTLHDICSAARPSKSVRQRRTLNSGAIVDRTAYQAMDRILNTYTMDRREKMYMLSDNSTVNSIKKLGLYTVIQSRKIYANLLDFYYLNSDVTFQRDNVRSYICCRKQVVKSDNEIQRILEESFEW